MNGKIIVVDQNIVFAEKVAKMLEIDRLNVFALSSGRQVLNLIQTVGVDVVVCGNLSSDMNCLDLFNAIKMDAPSTEMILMCENPTVELLEEAIKRGIFSYVRLPISEWKELNQIVSDAFQKSREISKNKQLIEDLLKKNQELLEAHHTISALHQDTEALYYFGRCLATSLNLDEIYAMMTNAANKLLNNRPTILFLFDEEKNCLYLKKAIGFHDSPPTDIILSVDLKAKNNLMKWFEEENYLNDLRTKLSRVPECYSFLSKPIIIHNKFFGFLTVFQSKDAECTERETNIFKQFVSQSAFVLENALLHERANELANHDELTGTYNRRYFQERIEEEIKRSGRQGGCFSLIIVDVDYFKYYNDTYGHIQGDILLKELVKVMKERLRSTDVVCRFGGDEFVILLMDTEKASTLDIGNQIRESIELNPNFKLEEGSEKKITISMGIAQYPNDGFTSIDLIRKADQALYAAKARGRNQVIS